MKISIITPSYNSAFFLERAIKSVLEQDYKDWEHWIIDGGSSDGTIDILKKYSHLKWVSEKDNGQADAMNKGFALSSGEVIVYLNADDYFFKGAFSAVMKEFDKGAVFVIGDVLVKSRRLGSDFVNKPRYTLRGMLNHWEPNSFCHNPVGYFYKREVQEKCPFNVDNYATMDLEFLLDASSKYEFTKIDKVLGCFDDGTDTKTAVTQMQFDYWRVGTFPYIERHLAALSLEERKTFKAERRQGYSECQKSSNLRVTRQPDLAAMKDVKLSVVIPCYNGIATLAKAVESVLAQDLPNTEILVIDDASQDDPSAFIRKAYGEKSNIRIIRHDENRKLGAARNTGMMASQGDFIFFLDCDDWIEDSALSRLLQVATETGAEVVQCGTQCVYGDGKIEPYLAEAFCSDSRIEALGYLCDYKLGSIAWNKLYRLDFLKKNDIKFVEGFWHEDVVFSMKVAFLAKKIVSIDDVFVNYLQRDGSITRSHPNLLHMKSYLRLIVDIEHFIHAHEIHSLDATEDLPERLLRTHGINDLYKKMIRYAEVNGFENFVKDLREAALMLPREKRYAYISGISFTVEQALYSKKTPEVLLSTIKGSVKKYLKDTPLFLPAHFMYRVARKSWKVLK